MSAFRSAVGSTTMEDAGLLPSVDRLIDEHLVLSLDGYQRLALRTAKPLEHQPALEHAAMGLVSDAGELVSAVKAIEVYQRPVDQMRPNILEECGDVLWFAAYAAHLHDKRLSEVATRSTFAAYPSDETDTVVHRALRLAGCACRYASGSAWPEHASTFGALDYLALTLEYLERVMDCYGLDVQTVMRENVCKLRARYPDKYSDAAAQARADKFPEGKTVVRLLVDLTSYSSKFKIGVVGTAEHRSGMYDQFLVMRLSDGTELDVLWKSVQILVDNRRM